MKRTAAIIAVTVGLAGVGACGGTSTAPASANLTACKDALRKADRVIDLDDEAFGYAAEAMDAAGSFNAARVHASAAKITAVAAVKKSSLADYETLAAACRAQ